MELIVQVVIKLLLIVVKGIRTAFSRKPGAGA
jgi:hypothetical protein